MKTKNKKGKAEVHKKGKKIAKHKKTIVRQKAKKTKKVFVVKKFPKRPVKKLVKKFTKKRIFKSKKKEKKITKHKIFKEEFSAKLFFKTKIKVIGIGGGGGSIVSEIGKSLEKATFVIADTDEKSLKKARGIKYFLFGQEKTRGLGTGSNPELAKLAAEESIEKVEKLFLEQDIVILISSLGGGVGSGATEIFAKAASNSGAIVLGIFTLPFKFEGKNKSRTALKYLKNLRNLINVSITIPNERIFKVISENTPLAKAFSVINKNLIESLESLIGLIYNPGLINIDFADLRSILKGKGNVAFLNTIEEFGKDRAEKICQKILVNPLYQNSNFIPEKILFNISSSSDLGMLEAEKISKVIGDVNPKAKVIFGISRGQEKNKIKTTLLMTGPISAKESSTVTDPVKEPNKKEAAVLAVKKEVKTIKKAKKEKPEKKREQKNLAPLIPIFQKDNIPAALFLESKMLMEDGGSGHTKKAIRRSGLEVKKVEELQESKKIAQEEEWEIPAFLRRVKYKS